MKKSYLIALLGLFIVCLLAVSVSAVPTITKTFDKDNPTFGSDTQKASNPDEDEEKIDDVILTINNDLATDIQVTGITFASSITFEAPGVDIAAQTDITQFPLTVTAGGTGDLTVKARIPHDLDAVDVNLEEMAFKVGVLTIATDGGNINVDVYMQRENNLELDGNVYVNDKRKGDLEDDIDEVRPGSTIRVEFTIENKFSSSADVELEGVEFEIRGDSDLDADETEDVDDIDADEEETGEIEFELESDIDDDKYNIEFLARAEDKYSARHGMSIKNEVEVDRETHDVVIEKSSLNPSVAQCGDTVEVKADLLNIGKKDEEDVYVKMQSSSALDIKEESERFDLDKDDDRSVRISFDVPENAEEKEYIVSLEVLGDNTFNDNTDSLTLTVEGGCFKPVAAESVSLASSSLTTSLGEDVTVDVQVVNTGNIESSYKVELTGADAWANIVSPKTVTVPAGETSLVSLAVSPQDDLEEGTYSGSVVVTRDNEIVFTKDVSVSFEKEEKASLITGAFLGGGTAGTVLFVIIDIILILIIILIIVKIFSRKKSKEEM